MKIWKKLKTENIFLDAFLPDKEAALRFVADACVQNHVVTDGDSLRKGMRQREETLSTGVGGGIAFPHTASHEAGDVTVMLVRPLEPVAFESLDGLPVDIILPIVIPEGKTALHLQILAGVSRLCKNSEFLSAVRQARDSEKLWEVIRMLEDQMAFH